MRFTQVSFLFYPSVKQWYIHHISEVGNPLKIRVDKNVHVTGRGKAMPVLRIMCRPSIADRLHRGDRITPKGLTMDYQLYAQEQRSIIDKILAGKATQAEIEAHHRNHVTPARNR